MSQSDAEPPPGMPRWVKIGGIIIILLILLVVVLVLTGVHEPGAPGPGGHGPGMLTGVALLISHHGSGRPALGDTATSDGIPSEG